MRIKFFMGKIALGGELLKCQETKLGKKDTTYNIRWRLALIKICIYLLTLVAHMVKRLPAMRETWVLSLGQEDPLEKEMTTHSSTLAWKVPWTEEPGRLQSTGSQRVGYDWANSLLSCSCSFFVPGKLVSIILAKEHFFSVSLREVPQIFWGNS